MPSSGVHRDHRSAFDLVDELAEAAQTEQRRKRIQQLAQAQLLIVDEFGMRSIPPTPPRISSKSFTDDTDMARPSSPPTDPSRTGQDPRRQRRDIRHHWTASSTRPRSFPSKESPTGQDESGRPIQTVANFLPIAR
jgi:hypothetical protein